MKSTVKATSSFIGMVVLTLSTTVAAQHAFNHPEKAVEYRQKALSLMQNNFAVMGDMIKGDITFDGTVFSERANDFVALAGMPWVAFDQPGAKPGKDTNALPAIWENWDDFMKKAEQFQNDAKALQQAALSGNQNDIRRAFMTTARNCKACHDAYKD